MKKYPILIIFFSVIVLLSCEEVVNIPLEKSEPRLVIDASIEWFKGTNGNNQNIRLSRTSGFYEENTEAVTNARIMIFSEDGSEFNFEHVQEGNYVNNEFQPELNKSYHLEIFVDEQVYTATEILVPVVPIDYIEQLNSGGFAGDEIEIKAYYTDPVETEDYYLFEIS